MKKGVRHGSGGRRVTEHVHRGRRHRRGPSAVWIFTEFETEASLYDLREWLRPDNWPSWGGSMFKEMRPTGSVTDVPALSGEVQTHANYIEVVEIGGQELETVLHCDIKSTPWWAAMSYDLDHSVGEHAAGGPWLSHGPGCRRPAAGEGAQGGRVHGHPAQHVRTTVCPEWGVLGAPCHLRCRHPGGGRNRRSDSRGGRRHRSRRSRTRP